MPDGNLGRRFFLGTSVSMAVSAVTGCITAGLIQSNKKQTLAVEISPAEDLMRGHGLLNRLLLIYEQAVLALEAQKQFDIEALKSSVQLHSRFINQYHEKMEDEHIFPVFEKAGVLVDAVKILGRQHQDSALLVGQVNQLCLTTCWKDNEHKENLVHCLRTLSALSRPHEAWEETVVYPAIKKLVGPDQYEGLGEKFAKMERQLFGRDGFSAMVTEVGVLQSQMGFMHEGLGLAGAPYLVRS